MAREIGVEQSIWRLRRLKSRTAPRSRSETRIAVARRESPTNAACADRGLPAAAHSGRHDGTRDPGAARRRAGNLCRHLGLPKFIFPFLVQLCAPALLCPPCRGLPINYNKRYPCHGISEYFENLRNAQAVSGTEKHHRNAQAYFSWLDACVSRRRPCVRVPSLPPNFANHFHSLVTGGMSTAALRRRNRFVEQGSSLAA